MAENPNRDSILENLRQKNPSFNEPKFQTIESKALFLRDQVQANKDNNNNDMKLKISSKGCNCKNSECKKKYCECFQNKLLCSSKCRCLNCKNGKHMFPKIFEPHKMNRGFHFDKYYNQYPYNH
jgi:hypothetical protein